jgi:hypothetical protein
MATPRLTPAQIAQVSGLVAQYIATQRERYASRAVPLSVQQRAAMDGLNSSWPLSAPLQFGQLPHQEIFSLRDR